MKLSPPSLPKRILLISFILFLFLFATGVLGLTMGSSPESLISSIKWLFGDRPQDSMLGSIIWEIRLPRVLMAALVGATLALGGLVFQALLRNPLAEPYILGISGGSAIGAIAGILLGFSRFPGVTLTAFSGSLTSLGAILLISSGRSMLRKDALLLSGVMINAFCSAIIMFMVSMTQDSRLHNIIFWLMGDLSLVSLSQTGILVLMIFPCFILLFYFSYPMNLILMGKELAHTMGVDIRKITFLLLLVTSFMISATVSNCGLLGFVGLVIPHLLRLLLGPDHRVLVPASILGGGIYMILCDLLARTLPEQGEIPVGVITAMIGAPVFIFLLKKSQR
ncbi:MAG: iron ABC transporter permease [Thermodesulfobacteriota bacterium]